MNKLSVVISAYNEENKIKECLDSVKFADEIIFIDNNSEDNTYEIALKYTTKIFKRPNDPMLNINKNYGILKATGDWVLVLDADERVMDELREEITNLINKDNKEFNGYYIPRKNIIFGKWIEHTGWYPDCQLRLIRSGVGKFPENHVHEMIKIDGKEGYLKGHLMHYNFESISQFIHKHMNIYAPNEAAEMIRNGYDFNWLDVIRFPSKEFLSRFFARKGYRDGLHGLVLSLLMAFYHLIIFSLIWEKKGFVKIDDKDILNETEKVFNKSYREIMFWFINEKSIMTKNILEKYLLKTKQKFFK